MPEPVPTAIFALNLRAYIASFLDNADIKSFRSGTLMPMRRFSMGRPMSPGSTPSSFCAGGVKRRIRRIAVQNEDGNVDSADYVAQIVGEVAKLALRFCNCSLSVMSSSLLDWSSSLAVSSSSLVL